MLVLRGSYVYTAIIASCNLETENSKVSSVEVLGRYLPLYLCKGYSSLTSSTDAE